MWPAIFKKTTEEFALVGHDISLQKIFKEWEVFNSTIIQVFMVVQAMLTVLFISHTALRCNVLPRTGMVRRQCLPYAVLL